MTKTTLLVAIAFLVTFSAFSQSLDSDLGNSDKVVTAGLAGKISL